MSGSTERRVRTSRVIVMATGAVAIVLFFVMPLVEARAFYEHIVRPAYGLPAGVEHAETRFVLTGEQGAIVERVGPAVRDDASWTPWQTCAVGAQLAADFGDADELSAQSAMVGRFLQLLGWIYVIVGGLSLALPVVRAPDSVVVNGLVGGSALVLLASHLLTVGIDLSGVVEGALFAWPSHLATAAIVAALGIGTGMAMQASTALRVVGLTVAVFLVAALGCGLWLA